jgi:hypothetical protein
MHALKDAKGLSLECSLVSWCKRTDVSGETV